MKIFKINYKKIGINLFNLGLIVIILSISFFLISQKFTLENNVWIFVTIIYLAIALLSFIPVLNAILKKVELHDGGKSFKESNYFTDIEKSRLINHYSRITGTLGFWKNQALKFKRFHYYVLCWTLPTSILIPIITLVSDSKIFLTVISTFTAILLSFHRGLKSEDNYKSYRHGESEFFDTYRRLLDNPYSFGKNKEEQILNYFSQVESIRRYVRNAETDNLATLDESKRKYESLKNNNIIQGV